MKAKVPLVTATAALALAAAISASTRNQATPVRMVVTVLASGAAPPPALQPADLTVLEDGIPAPVTGLQRLTGDLAKMQLFVLLDDSSQSASLSVHFPELRTFLESLPATTEVAIGYMRNGTSQPVQSFTTDHQQAANSLRLPLSIPGVNGSPYFALSELVDHWPSPQPRPRRAVLMLTDGVDPYDGTSILQDPYVDAAIRDTVKAGATVYSMYLRGAGLNDRNGWVTNLAQSRLMQVTEQTGGYSYFQNFSNPVTISPFLQDLQDRLDNQYQLTISSVQGKGLQSVKVRAALPGVRLTAPTRVFVP
jgi:hypothetical protein